MPSCHRGSYRHCACRALVLARRTGSEHVQAVVDAQLDNLPPTIGVPLGDPSQPLLDKAVERFVHCRDPTATWRWRVFSAPRGTGDLRQRARQRPSTYQKTAKLPTKKPMGQLYQKETLRSDAACYLGSVSDQVLFSAMCKSTFACCQQVWSCFSVELMAPRGAP